MTRLGTTKAVGALARSALHRNPQICWSVFSKLKQAEPSLDLVRNGASLSTYIIVFIVYGCHHLVALMAIHDPIKASNLIAVAL